MIVHGVSSSISSRAEGRAGEVLNVSIHNHNPYVGAWEGEEGEPCSTSLVIEGVDAPDGPAPASINEEDANGGGAFPVDSTTTTTAIPAPEDVSSFHGSKDHETPRWPFEAFPTLNRMRWFNSTKVAIVFCTLTTTMVSVAVIYNIVLAAHGNYQG